MRHPTFLPHSIPLHFLGGLALSLCFLPGAVMSGVAGGNVLFPTTTADELDTPSLAGSGQLSLREALRDASNGDTVILNAVAYSLTRGQLAITQNITVQDGSSTVGRAAISGGNQSRVFHIASGAIVTLDGLVIRDGNGVGSTLSGYGGGILSEGRLTISNSQVRNCNAAVDGGGIHQPSWNIGALELKHNIIHGNMGTPADLSKAMPRP